MKRLDLSLSALLVICGAAHAAPPATPAMGFEIEGVWLSAAPELFTELKPEEIWAARTMTLPELAAGVTLSGDHVKQGRLAGRWANHPQFPTIHTHDIPHDWRGVKSLSFWARSEVATGELITLALLSDGPQTAWKDYYWYTFRVDWTGWKQLRLALSDFEVHEQPAGWQQVDAIYFFTKIFGRQPNPYTVLCLDDLQLGDMAVKSDPPAWQPPRLPAGTIPVRGQAPAFDPTIVNHIYPEVRDPVNTPFQTLAYFQGVRACQGYYPRYHPGFVSFDPQRQRLFLCYWTQSAALCLFRDEYYAAVYMWPDRQKPFLEGNPELPLGSFEQRPAKYQFYSAPPSELTVIVSADRGKTWRLATTEDFRQ